MKPRIIALYLPQYHPIPENDEWWESGFTDWVNVKKAKPLFQGHLQPRVPQNNNYYDLSQPCTLRWQASLANKYGVYGFCFYHYWFAGGKTLLEKPAEILLANKDIPLNYCFSWANEPWTRSWDGKKNKVLIPQEYGGKDDWCNHFEYLLPFFKDARYIKEDGCPMFIIYKSQSMPKADEMMNLWNTLAIQNGFKGIHFVETLRNGTIDSRALPFKARMEFEPSRTNFQQPSYLLNYKRIRRTIIKMLNITFGTSIMYNTAFSFKEVTERAINLKSPVGTYGGVFCGWDNTPRRGLASTIVLPPSKQEFKTYLQKVIDKTQNVYKANYVFINAWNEWAEGTYLEPDETNGLAYLEAIDEVINS